jgi:hypothetical protein
MGLTRRDAFATVVTGLAVLVYAANHEAWNSWLVGSSTRWAAVVVTVLGVVDCALGSGGEEMEKGAKAGAVVWLLAAVGTAALAFAIWAIVTASQTALALLVLSMVVLWAVATVRHASRSPRRPVAIS